MRFDSPKSQAEPFVDYNFAVVIVIVVVDVFVVVIDGDFSTPDKYLAGTC